MGNGFSRWPVRQAGVYIGTGILVLLLIIGLIRVRHALLMVLNPFLVALILAYLLAPLVNIVEKREVSRSAAILLVFLVIALLVFVFSVRVVPPFLEDLQRLGQQIPAYNRALQEFFSHIQQDYQRFNLPPYCTGLIEDGIAGLERAFVQQLQRSHLFVLNLFQRVALLLLVPVLTFYFLRDEKSLKGALYRMVPRRYRPFYLELCKDIDRALGSYVRGVLLVSLVVGILSYVGLLVLKIDFPLVFAFILGITNLIPYVGPIIGSVPVLLVALLSSPGLAFKVLLMIVIIQQLESQLVAPIIIGRSTGMHPLAVILALLLGGTIFGFAGLILALPAAIALQITARHLLRLWQQA